MPYWPFKTNISGQTRTWTTEIQAGPGATENEEALFWVVLGYIKLGGAVGGRLPDLSCFLHANPTRRAERCRAETALKSQTREFQSSLCL